MNVEKSDIDLSKKLCDCPACGHQDCKKTHTKVRKLHDKSPSADVRRLLVLKYSQHFCPTCRCHFSVDMSKFAPVKSRFTTKVKRAAIDLVMKKSMTLQRASETMTAKHHVNVPPTTIHKWVKVARDANPA